MNDSPVLTCPSCGHENKPTSRFCAQCGTPLRTASSASAGDGGNAGQFRVREWDEESAQLTPPGWQVRPAGRFGPEPQASMRPDIPPPPTYDVPAAPALPGARPSGTRRPGISFVPYTTKTAGRLQSTVAPRTWLMPTILVLVAFTLLLVGLIIGLYR